MEIHQDRGRNEGDERSGERFYPPPDQPCDPEREKTDNCLLEASDLVLRRSQLNDEAGCDDHGAKGEETKVGDGIGVGIVVREPQPDREEGDSDKRDAKEQGQDRRPGEERVRRTRPHPGDRSVVGALMPRTLLFLLLRTHPTHPAYKL